MKKLFVFAVIFTLWIFPGFSQTYPKGYFIAPLDPPIVVTGTFGEIRENHFHSGIDLSTDEQEGLPVMAAADGYVSRIKISADGYGKALYITHSNGYVTVYGHLEKFSAPLNSYVRNLQYKKQTFELDVTPVKNEFFFKQRDVIAYSGSTGGAENPHLHFEIRDEKSEEPINPLLFGIKSTDTIPPVIKYIRVFPLTESGIVNNTDSAFTYDLRKDSASGKKLLNTYDYPIVYGSIGFGFGATDRLDSVNELGIYSAELYVDTSLVFSMKYDRFNFDNTRDVNAHIDYLAKKRDNQLIERCFRLPGDRLSFYETNSTNGYSFFGEDQAHEIRIVVKDFSGNKDEFDFTVISYFSLSENAYMPKPDDATQIVVDKGAGIHKSKLDVIIPEGAVYEPTYYNDESSKEPGFVSDLFRVGNSYEPLRSAITVGIKPNEEIPDSMKPKAVLVKFTGREETMTALSSSWNGKFLTAKSNAFGYFGIVMDTVKPSVEKYYTPADMNSMYGGVIKYIIRDELSGIKSYSGKVDGEWMIFEYDKKSDMITTNVDSKAVNLEHTVEITVMDNSGNTRVWKSTFYF